MTDRTLVIADIHENIRGVERIQAQAGPVDHTVFTGDWLDRKGGWVTSFDGTMAYLKKHHQDPDKTFLFGNHDISYLIGGWAECGGRDSYRAGRMDFSVFADFKLTVEIEGWTLSHAGFTNQWDVKRANTEALAAIWRGEFHPLLGIGAARGGLQNVGGCVWLDWNHEFQPVPELKQIVGHTMGDKPRWNGENLCLDTQLRNFAIIEDGRVTVHDVKVTEEDRRWLQRQQQEAWTR